MAGTYVMVDGLTTVYEGIRLAKKHHVKALIVNKRHDDDEYGIVLMNDIAKKVLAKNRSPKRTNIYEIMTKPALSVSPDMNVKYCARLFDRITSYNVCYTKLLRFVFQRNGFQLCFSSIILLGFDKAVSQCKFYITC